MVAVWQTLRRVSSISPAVPTSRRAAVHAPKKAPFDSVRGASRLYERAGFVAYGLDPSSRRLGDRTFDKLMMALTLRPA